MNRRRLMLLVAGTFVLALGGAAFAYFARNPAAWGSILARFYPTRPSGATLWASGFIEAEEVHIASELGGRVGGLFVEEGDDVGAGQLLVRIDGALLEARIGSAVAGVEIAEAEFARLEAGARPERIRQAEARLSQSRAARDGALQAWRDAQALRDEPQERDARIVRARAAVHAAEAALAEATALKDAAVIAHDSYWDAKEGLEDLKERLQQIPKEQRPEPPGLQLDVHMIPYQYWKAWVGVHAAEARLQGARSTLANLLEMRDNPQDLEAAVDASASAYHRAEAGVDQAQAELEGLRAGATPEEVAVAAAQVEQARAALAALLTEREKLEITAPTGGLVLQRALRAGEIAAPGATILVLGDLDRVTLTVYVPANRLGQVNVGQDVEVAVDSFPGEIFHGSVVAIADEAEFTPRNVQTKELRVDMVFAVDVVLPNPDHRLKPGVPADAIIITEEQLHASP